jgi:hypothetical protein
MTTVSPDNGGDHPRCESCGALLVEYRFGFNKALARFLGLLFEAGMKPVRTDSLDLTYSQRTNSQKLRYWGLADPVVETEQQVLKRGWWQITDKGCSFVRGEITIPKYAVTKRGKVIRFEGDQIYFRIVSGGYEYHGDYADQARRQLEADEQDEFPFND